MRIVVAAEVVIVYSVCPHCYYCCCCYSLLLAPFWRCCERLPRHVPLNRTLYASVVRSRSAALLFSRRRRRWLLLCLLLRIGLFVCVRSQQLFPSRLHILIGQSRMRLNNFSIPIDFQRVSVLHSFLYTFVSPPPPTCLSLLFAFLFIVFHALFYVSTLTYIRVCVCLCVRLNYVSVALTLNSSANKFRVCNFSNIFIKVIAPSINYTMHPTQGDSEVRWTKLSYDK